MLILVICRPVVSGGWLVPISAADRRAGRTIPADGQLIRIVFGR